MVRDAMDERYAHVQRRLDRMNATGAILIIVLCAASLWGKPRALFWLLGINLLLLPINSWITTVLLEKRRASSAEGLRVCINLGAALAINHLVGWPPAVWLWLVFAALGFDGFQPRAAWASLVAYCGAVDIEALYEHQPWILPVAFTAFAVFARVIVETRFAVLRDMFEQSEAQRRALDRAQRSLQDANVRLRAEIGAREQVELELRQAQRLEAIGALAAGIAHEINTPAQYVSDNISFLQRAFARLSAVAMAARGAATFDAGPGEATRELARAVQQARLDYLLEQVPRALDQSIDGLGRIAGIVGAMKEFSHPSSKEKEPIDVTHALETSLAVAASEWKHVADVQTSFDLDLPSVPGLRGELNQVFLNLIVNAAHAIGDAGDHAKGTIRVSTRREGGCAVVAVADTGCGIPAAIRHRIFEPFFTTKPVGKGTGQGLAISYDVVVNKHGGRIDVTSEVGKGSLFEVRLPLDAGARVARPSRPESIAAAA